MPDLIDMLDEGWKFHVNFMGYGCVWVDLARSLVAIPMGRSFYVRRFYDRVVDVEDTAIVHWSDSIPQTGDAVSFFGDVRHMYAIDEATRCLT